MVCCVWLCRWFDCGGLVGCIVVVGYCMYVDLYSVVGLGVLLFKWVCLWFVGCLCFFIDVSEELYVC